jgi:hypothetical protein
MTTASSILDRNLAALSVSSPQTAALIRQATPRPDVELGPANDGAVALIVGRGPSARALCSRRGPLEEGARVAATIDLHKAGVSVALGFGAGHHVKAMVRRIPAQVALIAPVPGSAARGVITHEGLVIAFEPDVPLLRAVLERIDHSDWMGQTNFCIVTSPTDSAAVSAAIAGREGLVAMGVKFFGTVADKTRLESHAPQFEAAVTSVVRATRTAVVTTLIQSETTFRNLLMNADRYAACPGIDDLKDAASGRPAIVVAAGPSLRRNLDLLARPGVRDRFLIIAVQTVLKPLLARGIRPHFVTALDYHEISRRFYEGLTAADVEGVTLVADPKANPAILESFPGAIRTPGDAIMSPDPRTGRPRSVLDEVVGPDLTPPRSWLPPAATVAHMAYYLARHMGCDPVILIGQDLGFTDGQYYAAGAAIHQVWSSELSEFNTLEMMEWQRIARLRNRLPDGHFNGRKVKDVFGRSIYTDEQMATYLVKYEQDFAADAASGLTTIDATEGGVAKHSTTPMPLAEALERYEPRFSLSLPVPRPPADAAARPARLRRRLESLRKDLWQVADHSRRAGAVLGQMLDADPQRVNRLIDDVNALRDRVQRIQPAFALVQQLNQTGTLKRAQADRELSLDEPSLTPQERQRRQIRRDIVNVQWLADAADTLGGMFDAAIASLDGAPKQTSDPIEPADVSNSFSGPRRVWALVTADPHRSGLGTPRDLSESFLAGHNPLRLTLLRLSRCKHLDGIAVLSPDPETARRLAGPLPERLCPQFIAAPASERADAIRGARLWSSSCWRAGLGNQSIFDEALNAGPMHRAMADLGLDAAAIINADWALVDPILVDSAVERYRQRPDGAGAHRLTFCQAPPGLGCCVIDRSLMQDLAERADSAGPFASIGGMLGYIPVAPASDPIAKRICITTPPAVRDAQFRFIPDSSPRRAALLRALSPLGDAILDASSAQIAAALAAAQASPESPHELILELCTGRRTGGVRCARRHGEVAERPVMSPALADRLLTELAASRADAAVTLAGAGDPLLHADVFKIVALARRAGIAGVHLRTDLLCDEGRLHALLDCGADVISVDLMAESAATYRAVMGADAFDRARANLIRLIERRDARPCPGGLRTPWIVPRLTRCDAVYEDIETFFDRWILGAGAAILDPLPSPVPGNRIEPLPIPADAVRRMSRDRMLVFSDGRVPASASDLSGDRIIGDAARDGLLAVWRRLSSRRHETVEPKPAEAFLHGGTTRARVASLDTH